MDTKAYILEELRIIGIDFLFASFEYKGKVERGIEKIINELTHYIEEYEEIDTNDNIHSFKLKNYIKYITESSRKQLKMVLHVKKRLESFRYYMQNIELDEEYHNERQNLIIRLNNIIEYINRKIKTCFKLFFYNDKENKAIKNQFFAFSSRFDIINVIRKKRKTLKNYVKSGIFDHIFNRKDICFISFDDKLKGYQAFKNINEEIQKMYY